MTGKPDERARPPDMSETIFALRRRPGHEPSTRIVKDGDRYTIERATDGAPIVVLKFRSGPEAGSTGILLEDLLVVALDRLHDARTPERPDIDNANAMLRVQAVVEAVKRMASKREVPDGDKAETGGAALSGSGLSELDGDGRRSHVGQGRKTGPGQGARERKTKKARRRGASPNPETV